MKLGDYTKHYFENNKLHLQNKYPGLTLERLKSELFNLYQPDYLDRKEFFSSPYNSVRFHLLDAFFLSLSKGVPLEYISGKKYFYNSEFNVNPDVLIPRSETEILVEKSIEYLNAWFRKSDERLKVCDVGTGSGCIILSILKNYPNCLEATAIDVSDEALKVAEGNFFKLQLGFNSSSTCQFLKKDRLKGVKEKFHLIVSNPPYIKQIQDKEMVHDQVFEYEPHLALFLKDNEYTHWFKEFFSQVYNGLYEEGVFIMEGHEDHLRELLDISKKHDWTKSEILQDYCDRDRFLILKK